MNLLQWFIYLNVTEDKKYQNLIVYKNNICGALHTLHSTKTGEFFFEPTERPLIPFHIRTLNTIFFFAAAQPSFVANFSLNVDMHMCKTRI